MMKGRMFILPQHQVWAKNLKEEFEIVVVQPDDSCVIALKMLNISGLPVALLNSKAIRQDYIPKEETNAVS